MRGKWKSLMAMFTALVVSGMVVGCGTQSSAVSNPGPGVATPQAKGKTWTIVLSNNYMSNEWRPQMENDATVVARQLGNVHLKIVNANNTITAQIASLENIIATKPNAIVIDAASATALNPVIEQAIKAGIVVVSFDEVVTAPGAYKLKWNYSADGRDMIDWLGAELHGHGTIFMDEGLPGIPISEAFLSTWQQALKTKFPGIHVVGTYSSGYDPGQEFQQISDLLVQHPHVSGVLSGAYPSAIIKAFKQNGVKLVPVTGMATNGNLLASIKNHVPSFQFSAPTWVSGEAIQMAVKVLQGHKEPMTSYAYTKNFQTNATHFPGTGSVQRAKIGVNVYPKLPAALLIPVTFGSFRITPQDALGK
ncbi:MAG: substrate-binding domain-containing protein [Bacilli bacterium]